MITKIVPHAAFSDLFGVICLLHYLSIGWLIDSWQASTLLEREGAESGREWNQWRLLTLDASVSYAKKITSCSLH